MSHSSIRRLLTLSVGMAIMMPTLVRASDSPANTGWQHAQEILDTKLSLVPNVVIPDASAEPTRGLDATGSVLTLDAGASTFALHGFADFKLCTQYITPRGLVAVEGSPQFQTVMGLVFDVYQSDGFINDISLIGGFWADLNSKPDTSVVTGADTVSEVDYFATIDVKFAKKWDLAYTIQAWTFPDLTGSGKSEIDPTTEYNMDLKLAFDDTEYLKDFALHPYVDFFWNFSGSSSPVVAQALLGKNDHTGYVELGIGPSYTFKGIGELPITFTMPTYFSFGDSSFWGESSTGNRSNLGVFSTGLKVSAPLKFIPKEFGNWSTYVGVSYIHTCNPALTEINSGSTGGDANLVLGYAGVGFNF